MCSLQDLGTNVKFEHEIEHAQREECARPYLKFFFHYTDVAQSYGATRIRVVPYTKLKEMEVNGVAKFLSLFAAGANFFCREVPVNLYY